MIRARGICKRYSRGTADVLSKLDLDVRSGEVVVICGQSGAGKSTLLNLIGGLDRDYLGSIEIAGEELHRMPDGRLSRFRNQKLGFLFQESHLIDGLSAIRNVTLPSTFSRSRNGRASFLRAEELFERLGIPELATVPVERLSGGQRQRVCVARALVEQPELLLCDEPTANLDVETGEELLTLLEEQNKDHGLTVVAVSHEAYVSHIADRVLNLANGVLVPMDNPCGGDL